MLTFYFSCLPVKTLSERYEREYHIAVLYEVTVHYRYCGRTLSRVGYLKRTHLRVTFETRFGLFCLKQVRLRKHPAMEKSPAILRTSPTRLLVRCFSSLLATLRTEVRKPYNLNSGGKTNWKWDLFWTKVLRTNRHVKKTVGQATPTNKSTLLL